MTTRRLFRWGVVATLAIGGLVLGHPFPGLWQNGTGQAIHYQPVAWPNAPVSPASCGASCGEWKPYTRFSRGITDARTQDASNGGTAPQNYVNVSSSCTDKTAPSIYYYLHKAAQPQDDVIMFRWRVEQPAHNYATGPSPGTYSATNPWSSAQWTVLFDIDGSGYRSLAAHLNGSSGSPAEPIDMLVGIWSNTPNQSIDYTDPNVHKLAHNPTAFIGPTNKLMNFHGALSADENWPNGSAETEWDYGTTRATLVSTSPCNEYFIDYQIPVAMLDATGVGGPKITRDTPIAMIFCTANSLSNPFQKDCAINRQWSADAAKPAPFGDYLSFNKTEAYQQPIVSSVTATAPTSCPGSYTLNAKVQDALVVQNGVIVPSIKSVQFYYWYDRNGDGDATAADTGSAWTRITPTATLVPQTLNTWTASWDATSLAKGKYLIGVQAVDDATALDDDMTSTGIDNRTFSYLSGDVDNKIYIAGTWQTGQQALFPSHSPSQSPVSTENWYGNPSVTGNQVALVGTAINACGVAPSLTLNASPTSVAAGASVNFTMTLSNPSANSSAITVSSIGNLLPTGFSYTSGTSAGTNGLPSTNPTISGQQLTWTLGSPISVNPGASATLSFSATAASAAGNYSSTATSTTSFGDLISTPAAVIVDSARVSLAITPGSYSVPADGSTTLVYSLRYANDSGVAVTGAGITNALPAGVTYVSCSGGSACSNSAGTVSWTLGSIGAGVSGTVSFSITVPSSYATYSIADNATLAATAPDSSSVTSNASATVAVTGIVATGNAALSLVKTASASAIAPGGSVTYTLSYTNYGSLSASSVVLTDVLPSGMTFVSCSNSCVNSSGTLTWNLGSLAAGASGSQTVSVTAANPFTATNPSNNTASIAWSGGTTVNTSVAVGVTGQSCSTYYFKNTTTNVGFDGTKKIANISPVPISSDTGTTVSATAPGSGSSFLEVLRFYQDPQTTNDVPFDGNITTNIYVDRNNGQGLNIRGTIYDYNSTSGATTQLGTATQLFNGSSKGLLSFVVTPSGTLQKGHRLLWVYEVRSANNSTLPMELQFGGTVTNGISSGTTFANSNAAYCVTPPANLTLKNSVSSAAVIEASTPTLTYTLKYSNTGGASATNATITGALPSNFTGCQYSTDNSSWSTCSSPSGSPPSHSFSLGTIASGVSGTVYVRGAVPSGTTAGNTLTSTSSISSDQTVSLSAATSTSVTGAIVGGTPSLILNLAANRSTAAPGSTVVYTLTVLNTGSANATNVIVSDTVPATSYYAYTSCTGSCGVAASTLTWPTIATLAPGASQSYTYTMTVGTSSLPSGVTVIADSAAATGDSALSATSNTANVSVNGNPSLVLLNNPSPSSGLKPNDVITYTLSVANTGAADASNVVVTNPIPVNTAYDGTISASQGSGSFDAIGNRVVFNLGTVTSGSTATLTFTAKINYPLPSGPTTITSTATADASNAAQQITAASATASATPILAITKSAPTSVAYPSAVLTGAANGTTLLVDRTDRLQVNQLIKIGTQVVRIVALSARSILVDGSVTASSGTPLNGAMTITIAYRNDGDANATTVAVRETLATGFGYYAAAPAANMSPLAGSSGDVDWTIGTLNAGTSATLQVLSFPTGTTGSFSNVSSITAGNATTATATSITTIGGLSVTKSSSTPVVSAGGIASYTITATNSLGIAATPVVITDKLPQGFSYRSNSATVGGIAVEPTFDGSDTISAQPIWSGLSVPANGSLVIAFQANIASVTGASSYQNELDISAPAGIGVMSFDPLLTTAEDVTVLAAASGVAKGYVFKRASGNVQSFDPLTDTPLSGVRVELHKSGANCAAPVNGNCFVVYTDSNGYFERVLAAEDWIVTVVQGTGDLQNGWTQIAGSNDNTITVPDQSTIVDYNGYTSAVVTTHLVSTSVGANGSVTPSSRTVNDGDTTTFTVTPDSGYLISSVSGCGGTLTASTYTTDVINAPCTVTASFISNSVPSYTVTASAGVGGSINPASALVASGSTTSFVVTADVGYSIVSVSGCAGSLSGSTFTTGAITGACAVTASFALNSYTVNTTAGAGGSISPTSANVAHGNTASFTITANAGFNIASVSGCGGNLSGATFTTAAVTGACTVAATFVAQSVSTYQVTASANTGGTISPAAIMVSSGGTTSFAVTPNSGYHVVSVSGCGGSLSGTTYTTGAIGGACAVAATFAVNTYTVTATSGTGGSITPASRSVNHGSTTTFTTTPNTGYRLLSVSGCSGSASGNTFTTSAITSACAVAATFEIAGPVIDPAPPTSIDATGLFTDVPLNIRPHAVDGNGDPLTVTLIGPTKLRPGRHVLTWSATDSAGVTVTATQQLDIWPIVSTGNDVVVGFGSSANFQVVLNGDAPVYPFLVSFTVGGDGGLGTLHNLAPGMATFASGTEATVQFDALPQGTSMPTRHLIVTLNPAANVGTRNSLNISLVSENAPPQAQILVTQDNRIGTLVARDAGPVVLHAVIADPNPRDTHTVQWSYPSGTAVQVSADTLTLTVAAQNLAAGLRDFSALVTDSGVPSMSVRARTTLAVLAASPVLGSADTNNNGTPDSGDGWSDSGNGVPSYLNRTAQRDVLPEDAPVTDKFLVEGLSGEQLRIGAYAQVNTAGGARIDTAVVKSLTAVDVINNVGGYFNVDATDLAIAGDSVTIVIPQRATIPANAVYRLWDADTSQWVSFVENGANRISSAPGEQGYCPSAGSAAYTPGLTQGNWCVQVVIEDGGANDGDKQKNAAMMSLGGVAERVESVVIGTSRGGGGGGAMGVFAWLLGILALARKWPRRIAALCSLALLVPCIALADEPAKHPYSFCKENHERCFYLGASLALVHNSENADDMDAKLASQGYVTSTELKGQTRLGGMLYGGYRWRRLALELGYTHLGRLDSRVAGLTPISQTYLHAISLAHPRSGEGPQLSLVASLPLRERMEVYGRAGVFYWRNTLSAEGLDQYTDVYDRKFGPLLGAGLQFRLREKLSARVEFDMYRLDSENLSVITAGITYRIGRASR